MLGFLIASYLLSVFQKPLLEAVHLVGHLPQIIFLDSNPHSYHSHNQEIHQHQLLSTIENQSDGNEENPKPLKNQNNKKKIEFVESTFLDSKIITTFTKSEFQYLLPFRSIFFDIKVPPPQFFS